MTARDGARDQVSPHLKLRAIVLRTVDYGESDRVVTLLTAERGKLAAFARGARASRRRFGGALEPFTLLAVEARERRGAWGPASGRARVPSARLVRAGVGVGGGAPAKKDQGS